MSRRKVVLVTGFPDSLLAQRVAQSLLRDNTFELRLLPTEPREQSNIERATELFSEISKWKERVVFLNGSAIQLDFGLSGNEYKQLAGEVSLIHHCAATRSPTESPSRARRINVGGAREAVELADAATNLQRLVHWSSTRVAGKATGNVLESDLSDSAGFFSHLDHSLFRAERLMQQEGANLPITILRPATIVGDSQSGEIDSFEGPYVLLQLLESTPADLAVPFPGNGESPLNLVPIDHVVETGLTIASRDHSLGRTFHIVEDAPLSAAQIFALLARTMGRPTPRGSMSGLSNTLLKLPGVGRFVSVPRAFVEPLSFEVQFDNANAIELLGEDRVACPPFGDYVETLVAYAKGPPGQRAAP